MHDRSLGHTWMVLRLAGGLLVAVLASLAAWPTVAGAFCTGDCDNSGTVSSAEAAQCDSIALGGALSACPNCDCNQNGTVSLSEVGSAQGNVGGGCSPNECPPRTPTPTATPAVGGAVCGNHVVEGSETCDDGGTCVGGSNAGTACTADAQCSGDGVCDGGLRTGWVCSTDGDCPVGRCARCKTFGGDGCAANCTLETDVAFNLVPGETANFGQDLKPGTSGTVFHGILAFATTLSGSFKLTVGQLRDARIPVTIKAASVRFPSTSLPGLSCTCQRGVAAKTCGGSVFERDGLTRSVDCTASDSACAGKKPCTFVHGAGNSGSGVVGCDSLDGVDVTVDELCFAVPFPPFGLSGKAAGGSAAILNSIASQSVAGFCPSGAAYGPDQMFCTADDPPSVGGPPETLGFVTRNATGYVGRGQGSTVGAIVGAPFSCAALQATTPSVAGVELVSVSTDVQTGDVANIVFAAQPGPPNTPASTPTGPTPTATPPPPTCTNTPSPTFTFTRTPTNAFPATATATAAATATATSIAPSATPADTPTTNPTSTATLAATPSPTEVATTSPEQTATPAPTNTPSNAGTPTTTAAVETPTSPPPTAPPTPTCGGDCDGDGNVTVNELITMVNIALGNADITACRAGDLDGDGAIAITEIITAVNNALNGCPL